MPWCEPCGRFYNPNTLNAEGKCPGDHQVSAPGENDEGDEAAKVPWHFWLLVVALVAYLGWRVIVGVGWLLS